MARPRLDEKNLPYCKGRLVSTIGTFGQPNVSPNCFLAMHCLRKMCDMGSGAAAEVNNVSTSSARVGGQESSESTWSSFLKCANIHGRVRRSHGQASRVIRRRCLAGKPPKTPPRAHGQQQPGHHPNAPCQAREEAMFWGRKPPKHQNVPSSRYQFGY